MNSRTPQPFSIGADQWPGLAKVAEEAGEVIQVIGKLMAFPDGHYPDGTDLTWALTNELGDLKAAIEYAVKENGLQEPVRERMAEKRGRFRRWHREERGVIA